MASGFDVLSDDFLPVESETGLVFRFPAALSIKKRAIDMLLHQFPELQNAKEYENPAFQKIFRFLPPVQTHLTGVPCKALFFVKYDKSVGFSLEKMPHVEAFSELVPDSWIAPAADNATRFLKWFKTLPCYRLTYSDNKKMVDTIKEMLEHK